jgi:hypothetical protein
VSAGTLLAGETRAQVASEGGAQGPVLRRTCCCGGHVIGGGECEQCRRRRLHGEGRPLDPEVARRFTADRRFLSSVRVHDGIRGAEVARRLGAAAVAEGTDVFFAPNAYRPATAPGLDLLAHELVHVAQQHRPDGPAPGHRSRAGDAWEREADRLARMRVLPPVPIGAVARSAPQRRTAAEQVATVLRRAAEGLGTDEDAIFNALTGRTPQEIEDIKRAYLALSGGETLEAMLHDELSGDDLSHALSLLQGETPASEAARRLWDAVRGPGTDEESIYAVLAGRTVEQWAQIQAAYKQMAGEDLITRLQDELSSSDFKHLQTLLPGAPGGAATTEDMATVVANQLQLAVAGPGTDEDAIYAALTGRSDAELREIERRFKLLTGEDLDARLRDELTRSEYERAGRLLHPPTNATRLAMRIRDAVQGPGTDEGAIYGALTARSPAELAQIRAEYLRMYGESLSDRLKDEMSGGELLEASTLERGGLLDPEDEIKVAIQGAGTDEERLFAVLEEINTKGTVEQTIDRYAAKGYGDMLDDIRGDLSGDDLDRAMELLHGKTTTTAACSPKQRENALEWLSDAITLAQTAIAKLNAVIAAGKLTREVENALTKYFNPGGAANVVNVGLAAQVNSHFVSARSDLLHVANLDCAVVTPCVAKPDCSLFTGAWTTAPSGATVHLCPALFECSPDEPVAVLHEFIHHTGVLAQPELYVWHPSFKALTPPASLNHADAFAHFAKDVS